MIDKKTPFTEAEISALFREREIDEKYFKRFYHNPVLNKITSYKIRPFH